MSSLGQTKNIRVQLFDLNLRKKKKSENFNFDLDLDKFCCFIGIGMKLDI